MPKDGISTLAFPFVGQSFELQIYEQRLRTHSATCVCLAGKIEGKGLFADISGNSVSIQEGQG